LQGIDGTSCSTPIFSSIVAILNDHQKRHNRPRLGFLNPLLYKMANNNAFNSVLSGNNSCTEAGCCSQDWGFYTPPNITKWNPVSGLGEPNVGKFLHYLDNLKYFFIN
jgi:tripeptidyl-peptidase-1